VALGLAAITALAGACGSDSKPSDSESSPVRINATVTNEGVELDEVELQVPAEYSLEVQNDSTQDCTFSFGTFIDPIDLAVGASKTVTFGTTEANEQIQIGCGDQRTASVLVRMTGN
jgi:hypothetical protein